MKNFLLHSIILLFTTLAFAETYDFSNELTYSIMSKKLKPGDVIRFTRKNKTKISFTIEALLGEGASDMIYAVKDQKGHERAIRLNQENNYRLNQTIEGRHAIRLSGIDAVKVWDSEVGKFVVVEKMGNTNYSLFRMLSNLEQMDPTMRTEMKDALVKFAEKSAMFSVIDDFHFDQIRYDVENKKWILLDWGSWHNLAFRTVDGKIELLTPHTIFDEEFWRHIEMNYDQVFGGSNKQIREEISELRQRIDAAISKVRTEIIESKTVPPYCSNLLRKF